MQLSETLMMGGLICLLSAGFNYCEYIPSALEPYLREDPYNATSAQYQMLYVSFFLSAFLFVIPMGIFIHSNPIRHSLLAALIFLFFAQVGLGFTFLSRFNGYWILVCIFRGVFGLFGVGLLIMKGIIITKYMKESYEIIIAFIFNLPTIFFGLSSLITTRILVEHDSIPMALEVGAIFCLISFVSGVLLVHFYLKNQLSEEEAQFIPNQLQQIENRRNVGAIEKEKKQYINNNQEQSSEFEGFEGVKRLDGRYWKLVFAIFLHHLSYTALMENIQDILVRCYGVPYDTAGKMISCQIALMTFVALFMGYLSGQIPKFRRKIVLILGVLLVAGLFVLYNLDLAEQAITHHYVVISIYFLLFTLAVASDIFLQTFVSYLVREEDLGIAWGFVGMAVSVAEMLGSVVSITIMSVDKPELPNAYRNLILASAFISIIAVLMFSYLNSEDQYEILDKKLLEIHEDQKKESEQR